MRTHGTPVPRRRPRRWQQLHRQRPRCHSTARNRGTLHTALRTYKVEPRGRGPLVITCTALLPDRRGGPTLLQVCLAQGGRTAHGSYLGATHRTRVQIMCAAAAAARHACTHARTRGGMHARRGRPAAGWELLRAVHHQGRVKRRTPHRMDTRDLRGIRIRCALRRIRIEAAVRHRRRAACGTRGVTAVTPGGSLPGQHCR